MTAQSFSRRDSSRLFVFFVAWLWFVGTASAAEPIRWRPLPSGYQPALATAVTPDGQFAVASRGNRLLAFHLPTGTLATTLVDPDLVLPSANIDLALAHRDLVRCLAFDAAGEVLASGSYREVKLWRRPRVTSLTDLSHDAALQSVAMSSDRHWVAIGDDSGRVHLWDASTNKLVRTITAHQATVTALVFASDSTTLFSSSLDKSLKAWNVANGGVIGTPVETPSPIRAAGLVANGQWLVVGCDDGIARVWETNSLRDSVSEPAKPRHEITAHTSAITAVATTSGKAKEFLTGGADGLIRRWQVETAKQVREWRNDGPVVALAASPDGQRVAAATANVVTLWSGDGKQIAQRRGDPRLEANVAKLDAEVTFTKTAIAQAQQDLKSYEGLIRIAGVRKEDIKKAEDELAKAPKSRDEKQAALDKAKADNGKVESAEKALADAENTVIVAGTVVERAKAVAERTAKELADAEQAVAAREQLLKQQETAKAEQEAAAKATTLTIRSLAFTADGKKLAIGCESGVLHCFEASAGHWSESPSNHQAGGGASHLFRSE